jgi:hypothetical protein
VRGAILKALIISMCSGTYGIRTYYNGSILETHVDRVETHILSAVYCVDRKHNKPWLMETDPDLLGNNAKVGVLE